jgi:hypothetical protein
MLPNSSLYLQGREFSRADRAIGTKRLPAQNLILRENRKIAREPRPTDG